MNVRLVTHHAVLAESVAKSLRDQGHTVDVRPDTVFDSELRYAPTTALSDVTGLVEQLKPLLPTVQPDNGLSDRDVELRLGESKPFASWEVKVYVESEGLGDRLRTRLLALGFRDDGLNIEEPDRNLVKFGGATPFARQVVRWLMAQEGIQATESKDWGDDDDDIWIYAKDPAFEGKEVRERYPIEIHGDDYERMFLLKERLEAAGFAQVNVRSLDTGDRPQFSLARGPMDKDPEAALELTQVFKSFLADQGVDEARYPPKETESAERTGHARIELPLAAMSAGSMRPYAGSFPERWEVVLRTDDASAIQPLKTQLQDNGYTDIKVEALPSTAFGFALRWGGAREEPDVADFVSGIAQATIDEAGLSGDYPLTVSDAYDLADPRVVLDLPLSSARGKTYAERLSEAAAGWECTLKAAAPDDHPALQDALRELPWKTWATETETDATPEIQYGGAPVPLVEHVREIVHRHTGIRLPISKDWSDSDDDIWIHLPSSAQAATVAEDDPLDLTRWLTEGVDASAQGPLVEVRSDRVRIGPVTLRRQHVSDTNLVPQPSSFAHYCLDQRTAETLIHCAESVMLREPCLLEGETSVSKTSIVQYLAMLLGQPLVRLNLNGQTDTGELVGRYVPQDVAATLPVDPGELLAAAELLESESRMILERAQQQGRTLTRVEIQQIMANERMTVHPWRWQDGMIVKAMRRGWWIVLDELNLAEPQILERLNPVLERYPTLVLSEHDNTVIGSQDHPVHPAFRIFATMNPAEYAGRSPLSPAYRDRWRAYRYVQAPGESEYLDMLRYLVFGTQPEVAVVGGSFQGGQGEAPLGMLADVEGIDDFLRALARFHAALEEAVGRRGGRGQASTLGMQRRETYVFTRRGLLAVMDYLASALATDGGGVRSMRAALARYYLGRVMPGSDQRVVASLLDAAGIGPSTWAPHRLDQRNAGPTDDDDGAEDGAIAIDFDAGEE